MEVEKKIIIEGKTDRLFSRGILATKLEFIGFSFTNAYEFSIRVRNELLKLDTSIIKKEQLDSIVHRLLLDEYSKELAETYILMERWRKKRTPIHILIAGAIGVGKSTLARKVAGELGIQHIIGTDIIRGVLKQTLSPEIRPELHSKSYFAYKYLREIYSTRYDDTIIGFENHAKYVNVGVDAVLSRSETESISIVIFGEHLLPSFFDSRAGQKGTLVYVTLKLANEEIHKENLYSQYSRDRAILMKNFARIRTIHDYLMNETAKRRMNIIEADPQEKPIKRLREIIVKHIKTNY